MSEEIKCAACGCKFTETELRYKLSDAHSTIFGCDQALKNERDKLKTELKNKIGIIQGLKSVIEKHEKRIAELEQATRLLSKSTAAIYDGLKTDDRQHEEFRISDCFGIEDEDE